MPATDPNRGRDTGFDPYQNTVTIRLREARRPGITDRYGHEGDQAIHWVVDEEYVGRSGAHETLFWTPRAGRFNVRVVDESGRAGSRTLEVVMVE